MTRPRKVGGPGLPGRGGLPALPTILLVGADQQERAMLRDALLEGTGPFDLRTVADADELDGYLARARENATGAPTPRLVLVDLDRDAPHPCGAIERIKQDDRYRGIPVVALAGTAETVLAQAAYTAGANTVVPKPVTFLALVRLAKTLTGYWLETAILPGAA
jgi:CheY-like chemotaxis protein